MSFDKLPINDNVFVVVQQYQPFINNFYINDKNFEKETEDLLKTYGLDNVITITDTMSYKDFQGTVGETLYSAFYINGEIEVVQFNITDNSQRAINEFKQNNNISEKDTYKLETKVQLASRLNAFVPPKVKDMMNKNNITEDIVNSFDIGDYNVSKFDDVEITMASLNILSIEFVFANIPYNNIDVLTLQIFFDSVDHTIDRFNIERDTYELSNIIKLNNYFDMLNFNKSMDHLQDHLEEMFCFLELINGN